jgi:hypothetical protein
MDRQRQIEAFLHSAHRLAVARLRSEPARVLDVQAQLQRWRQRSGRTRSDVYWDEWESLLRQPIDEIERVVCADDQHATVLRSVSPISVLFTQRERAELLRQSRQA